MNIKPFDSPLFLGYVNEVSPQKVSIHFPSANLLSRFRHEGIVFAGGNVGEFILIEGDKYGFLAQITELRLPDSERKVLSEKAVHEYNSVFHPIADAELLLSFSISNIRQVERTISRFPEIGAKVYSCSQSFIKQFVMSFGQKIDHSSPVAQLGELVSNEAPCTPSLDSLFGRHCAVVGTTGSGKSWTVARLLELLISNTKSRIILLDPTGEYSSFDNHQDTVISKTIGEDCFYPYEQLNISDLFCLLRPTAQSQRPVLTEAIRSLKTVKIAENDTTKPLQTYIKNGLLEKQKKKKHELLSYQWKNSLIIDNIFCDFDITKLAHQINNECIYPTDYNNSEMWGDRDNKTYDFQTSLKFRIGELLSSKDFDNLFNFTHHHNNIYDNDLTQIFKKFLIDKSLSQQVLRLDFSKTSSSFNAREIIANAIGKYLYASAKKDRFRKNPVIIIIDEAHLFLNKNLIDAEQSLLPLDAFDLIAKECRKFGLFLCLATQMPRDIPVGTLSQMGTFIVHRLINEQDKRVIETACSSATRSSLSYLPVLGAGEALLTGVDFPMSIILKIKKPSIQPKSETPFLINKS